MKTENLTIGETIDEVQTALKDYIEATYHISDPTLIAQRKRLLETVGVIHQEPYIESTPRYHAGKSFTSLDIPNAAKALMELMSLPTSGRGPLLFDPPYRHQSVAIEAAISQMKSLVVTTGTGSGKTESFLLPILSKLAIEAQSKPDSFAMPAVRALLLYPMNALVNDQLGRLRLMFGDPVVSAAFLEWAGRPARFARYTSRTLYPGVRTVAKDQERLHSIGEFYVDLTNQALNDDDDRHAEAAALIKNLKDRGKWPSKPDISEWYGKAGKRWQNQQGEFQRAVMLNEDPELLTRHEVIEKPSDLLVTNYSMLEYMLMRPLERPIFDRTREWLSSNPEERLLLIIDEAHLYRGAAGTEVGLLLRRFRDRLDISPDRLQVICTSASFEDQDYAAEFAANLTGKQKSDFVTISGELALRENADVGNVLDANNLAAIDLGKFYDADSDADKLTSVSDFVLYRGVQLGPKLDTVLYEALKDFPPLNLLVNFTMQEARLFSEISGYVFPGIDSAIADKALTVLIALGSSAKPIAGQPGLFPCRIHTFFRGLPGIWACIDQNCTELNDDLNDGPTGAIYSQPRDTCHCGARVFEFYTCRNCGAAYARAYTDNVERPNYLWAEPGNAFESAVGHVEELEPLDLLLEAPGVVEVDPADLDLITGRLNPEILGDRTRGVFLKSGRMPKSTPEDDDENPHDETGLGEFRPCGVCNGSAMFGRTSVQDHQTKGDQPFQALITRQLQVQPPSPNVATEFAPLRGRKILIFSDSRQTAARLAPNLQDYSMRDALRPLILRGWRDLEGVAGLVDRLSLDDLYLSTLLAAQELGVRLRPKLKGTESLHIAHTVRRALSRNVLESPMDALELVAEVRNENPPESLMRAINETLTSPYFGLQSLALASVKERGNFGSEIHLLPDISVARTDEEKLALVRMWIGHWAKPGYWFRSMGESFRDKPRGVRSHSGKFSPLKKWIGVSSDIKVFEKKWMPVLLEHFTENVAANKYQILAQHLALQIEGQWAYCQVCRSTQRPFVGSSKCAFCSRTDSLRVIDPDEDDVFKARKGYYRASSLRVLNDHPEPPMSIIAAEHTAQLNAAQSDEVFSRAEQYELLFQDVNIGISLPGEQNRTAIDVLSCTTTMEVGIDIGALSGVALRNMPPARSSYQQRAGRAGRRGNALATVLAYGSADSHDEQYFREPQLMVRGPVRDPILALDNAVIARRHVTAYLLQKYLEFRLPLLTPDEHERQLFEVLGSVKGFMSHESILNLSNFEAWLTEHQEALQHSIDQWLPTEIVNVERTTLLDGVVSETLTTIVGALPMVQIEVDETEAEEEPSVEAEEDGDLDVQEEVDDEADKSSERSAENLLDRLLYMGVLPRYAFPTDVVSFHVFDRNRSTRFRPAFEYSPSQGLPVALSQYAPGKEVWIDGKLWTSGALYSPMQSDRKNAWANHRLYFECIVCHYASTVNQSQAEPGEKWDCPACGTEEAFGAAKNWMRPPGFAHRQGDEEGTSPEDMPTKSYATRAKLVFEGPQENSRWKTITPHIREYFYRTNLLVTNSGPRREGYTYCTICGIIDLTARLVNASTGEHPKPYPDPREPNCKGSGATRGLVLGTDFISDVLLIRLEVESPLTLQPGYLATDVALRTMSEAISIAASQILEIEPGELQAEYRPALTPGGHGGLKAEIYVYDTLAGGAGFAKRIGDMDLFIFQKTLELLEKCPSNCDRSCYRCIRSFKNRFEHGLLDRHVGASLLRYLMTGEKPVLTKTRLELSTDRLFADLDRFGVAGADFVRNAMVEVPEIGKILAPILVRNAGGDLIVALHAPLTPDYADNESLQDAAQNSTTTRVLLIDEILVSQHLPRASGLVLAEIGR